MASIGSGVRRSSRTDRRIVQHPFFRQGPFVVDLPRLLFDLRPVRPPISGVARYCIHLAVGLAAFRDDFDLLGLYYGNRNSNEALRRTTELTFPSVSNVHPKLLNTILEFFPALSGAVVRGKFDLVHETYFANAYGTKRQKKVATVHDVIPIERPDFVNPRNRYFSQRNFRRQCREADRIICVSEYTKRKVIEYGNAREDRITVIPCGVTPVSTVLEEGYLEANGLDKRRYVLFIGNIEPRKNIGLIYDALLSMGPSFDDVHLVVAGHLNYQAEPTIARGRELLGGRFHYLGHVTEAQKWTLMKSANAFVFPSLYEGFGIPIVECYQARCPVLIADNTALTELSVDDRQLFDARSSKDAANRIAELLGQPSWVGQSVERGAATLGNYDWRNVAHRTVDIYRQALGD